jgi:hypothetical protein
MNCSVVLFCLVTVTALLVRRVWFNALSAFPGPKLVAAFSFPHFYAVWTGREKVWYQDLHRKYGLGSLIRLCLPRINVLKARLFAVVRIICHSMIWT